MKIFLILLLSFSTTCACFAQVMPDDSGFTNKAEAKNLTVNGLKEGKWALYTKAGGVSYDSNVSYFFYTLTIYKADKPTGISRTYYPKSIGRKLMRITHYSNGKKNGIEKWYYESGALNGEVNFIDDMENGIGKVYFENTGKVQVVINYSNGVAGETTIYDEKGNEIKKVGGQSK